MEQIGASPASFGADARFTHSVAGVHLAPAGDPLLHAYVVQFEACGRTAWHAHERGQLLICTVGLGYVASRDGTVIELRPGIAAWTDPGEEHWHGAGPDGPMAHIAVQTETPDADSVIWLESVLDADWMAAHS